MPKLIIAGSVNMDIVAFTKHIPVKGETVLGSSLKYFPGGKGGNQAVAAARMGAETHFIGCVGDDAFAETLTTYLAGAGVETHIRQVSGVSSGTALIIVADNDNVITVVPGANLSVGSEDLTIDIQSGDILLSQFEIGFDALEEFFRKGKAAGATTILNPSPYAEIPAQLRKLTDILIVNEGELMAIAGVSGSDAAFARIAKEILTKDNYKAVIVTLGASGVMMVTEQDVKHIQAEKVEVVDTTGAGDCFAGAFASSLCGQATLEEAVRLASRAAAISVTREGASTSSPTLEEVTSRFGA